MQLRIKLDATATTVLRRWRWLRRSLVGEGLVVVLPGRGFFIKR